MGSGKNYLYNLDKCNTVPHIPFCGLNSPDPIDILIIFKLSFQLASSLFVLVWSSYDQVGSITIKRATQIQTVCSFLVRLFS